MAAKEKSLSPSFEKLKGFAVQKGQPLALVATNANDMILLSKKCGKLYKYSSSDDTWSALPARENGNWPSHRLMCYDQMTDNVIICEPSFRRSICSINVSTGVVVEYPSTAVGGVIGAVVLVERDLHIFCNMNTFVTHQILNITDSSITTVLESVPSTIWKVDFAVFSESKKSIILLTEGRVDGKHIIQLFEFSLRNQQYHHLLDWSPICNALLWRTCTWLTEAFVLSLNGRYGVAVCTSSYPNHPKDERERSLMIFDLKTFAVRKSDIKCLIKSRYRAVLVGSNQRDELTTFGFVRQTSKSKQLQNIKDLPVQIIQLISKWYCSYHEKLHLIAERNRKHWSITMEQIIQSVSSQNSTSPRTGHRAVTKTNSNHFE